MNKQNLLCIVLFLLGSIPPIWGQALQTSWVKSIEGSLYEQSNSIAIAPCGDVYMVGFFQQQLANLTAVGAEDGFIAKYTSTGNLIWLKQLRGSDTERLNSINILDDNQIILGGEFKGKIRYNNDSLVAEDRLDAFVCKMDSSGQILWANSLAGKGFESVNSLTLLANNNIVATGYFEQDLKAGTDSIYVIGARDIFVWQLDINGNSLWLKNLGGPGFDEGFSIATDGSNHSYITGNFRDALFVGSDTLLAVLGTDVFVAKFNNTGQLIWVETMGGFSSDYAQSIAIDHANNICITGWYNGGMTVQTQTLVGHQEEDAFLIKLDSSGSLIWAKDIGHKFDERGYEVDFDANNNVYLLGTLDSLLILNGDSLLNRHLNRPTDIFLAKFDANGNYKWAQTLGHYYNDFCYDMQVIDASEIYITGSFQDTTIYINDTLISQAQFDVFLAKFQMDTTLAIPYLNKKSTLENIALYPNPCKDIAFLEYSLKTPSTVSIQLFDLLGRPTQNIINQFQNKGKHSIPIHRRELERGYYFIKIETKGTIFVHKILFE